MTELQGPADTPPGSLTHSVSGGLLRVVLAGEIDAALRDDASAVLTTVITSDLPVDVDASGVTFIDSSGVGFVVQLCFAVEERAGTFRLVDPPQAMRDVLDMLGLTERLRVVSADDSIDTAQDEGSLVEPPTAAHQDVPAAV